MPHPLVYLVARVLLSVDVLSLGLRASLGFEAGMKQLAVAGFPVPALGMGLATVAAWVAGVGFLRGRSPLPMVAFLLLCFPIFGVLAAMYSGSAWGDFQWLLQLFVVLEIPAAAGVAAFLLTADPRRLND